MLKENDTTTIVVDRKLKIMVADRMMVAGGNHKTRYKKIRKYSKPDVVLIGTCGDSEVGEAFVCWYEDQMRKDKGEKLENSNNSYPHTDTFHALVLHKDGRLSWYGKQGYAINITERYFGIGSGSDFALGAIMAGADLRKAVRIASLCDINTGLGIQEESFDA